MTLRTQSEQEKTSARRFILYGFLAVGVIGVLEAIFGGWFAATFYQGFITGDFHSLWTPPSSRESVESLVISIFFPIAALIFMGLSTLIEDYEVRSHRGPGPMYNPVSISIGFPALALIVGGTALFLRQLYLLIWVY